MNTEAIKTAKELRDNAEISRKTGDGYLRLKPPKEDEAIHFFNEGVVLLNQALDCLNNLSREEVKNDLAETYGSLGGLYRRLGETHWEDALNSYSKGAHIEQDFKLSSTYNRLNAIKLKLLLGKSQLRIVAEELNDMVNLISVNLRTDPDARESGWAYADLGDCLALLDHVEEAEKAYSTFIEKAESASPKTTLAILRGLAKKLVELNDPDAGRVLRAASQLEERLN